jgi:transcriptional regulator with XRE-family HTH domain
VFRVYFMIDSYPMNSQIEKTMVRARLLFDRSGLSLSELGNRMGYSEASAKKSAWQFLRKTTDPRLSMLERFAEALNVTLGDLVK